MEYRIVRGVVRYKKRSYGIGDLVPEGVGEKCIASWLEDGRIVPDEPVPEPQPEPESRRAKPRKKWRVDPRATDFKSYEELLMMVHEIDPDVDLSTIPDEVAAVHLLTSDWIPEHDAEPEPTAVSDSTKPRGSLEAARRAAGVV